MALIEKRSDNLGGQAAAIIEQVTLGRMADCKRASTHVEDRRTITSLSTLRIRTCHETYGMG